jgi:long-chain acyl-CoA synthetase
VLGQVIKAFVVAKDGEMIDTQALLTACGEKMPRYMVPKVVEVLVELPKRRAGRLTILRCAAVMDCKKELNWFTCFE